MPPKKSKKPKKSRVQKLRPVPKKLQHIPGVSIQNGIRLGPRTVTSIQAARVGSLPAGIITQMDFSADSSAARIPRSVAILPIPRFPHLGGARGASIKNAHRRPRGSRTFMRNPSSLSISFNGLFQMTPPTSQPPVPSSGNPELTFSPVSSHTEDSPFESFGRDFETFPSSGSYEGTSSISYNLPPPRVNNDYETDAGNTMDPFSEGMVQTHSILGSSQQGSYGLYQRESDTFDVALISTHTSQDPDLSFTEPSEVGSFSYPISPAQDHFSTTPSDVYSHNLFAAQNPNTLLLQMSSDATQYQVGTSNTAGMDFYQQMSSSTNIGTSGRFTSHVFYSALAHSDISEDLSPSGGNNVDLCEGTRNTSYEDTLDLNGPFDYPQ